MLYDPMKPDHCFSYMAGSTASVRRNLPVIGQLINGFHFPLSVGVTITFTPGGLLMRDNTTFTETDQHGTELVMEMERRRDPERASRPLEIYRQLLTITGKGNHAEVKQCRDGSLVIYEVKKNKIV